MPQNCYITTPLYYVNDIPHIGHAYTTTLADVLVRYHKLFGSESYLMTGTDEHGQKVQQAAKARGVEPQSHVDEYNLRFKQLWQRMDIQYDKFIRTTDSDHKAYVVESLQKLFEDDEIYFKDYAGWYSVSEERFFAEDE
jgi:methionyl-tRNA synthetase